MLKHGVEFGVRLNVAGVVTFEVHPSLMSANRSARLGQIDGVVSKTVVRRVVLDWREL
jgi:hypothetical protein